MYDAYRNVIPTVLAIRHSWIGYWVSRGHTPHLTGQVLLTKLEVLKYVPRRQSDEIKLLVSAIGTFVSHRVCPFQLVLVV